MYIKLHFDNGGSCDTNDSSVEESTFIGKIEIIMILHLLHAYTYRKG